MPPGGADRVHSTDRHTLQRGRDQGAARPWGHHSGRSHPNAALVNPGVGVSRNQAVSSWLAQPPPPCSRAQAWRFVWPATAEAWGPRGGLRVAPPRASGPPQWCPRTPQPCPPAARHPGSHRPDPQARWAGMLCLPPGSRPASRPPPPRTIPRARLSPRSRCQARRWKRPAPRARWPRPEMRR